MNYFYIGLLIVLTALGLYLIFAPPIFAQEGENKIDYILVGQIASGYLYQFNDKYSFCYLYESASSSSLSCDHPAQ